MHLRRNIPLLGFIAQQFKAFLIQTLRISVSYMIPRSAVEILRLLPDVQAKTRDDLIHSVRLRASGLR